MQPDKRFVPICHGCGLTAVGVHSWTQRRVRDLNMAAAKVWLDCRYRKIICPLC
ncbi:transposase family protein [Thermodesulfobacteriota bacterium]